MGYDMAVGGRSPLRFTPTAFPRRAIQLQASQDTLHDVQTPAAPFKYERIQKT